MKIQNEFYDIVNDTADLLRGGVRRVHRSFDEFSAEMRATDERDGDERNGGGPAAVSPVGTGRANRERDSILRVPGAPDFPAVIAASVLTAEERKARLEELASRISECTACDLHRRRTYAVPGTGVLDPLVMVIGEGPGGQEDRQGIPFVGPAGQYLDRWLDSIALSRRTNVFIGNIVKCRPPGNRDPKPEESETCIPFLIDQIALVRPRIILTVGRISTRILTGTAAGITSIHGKLYDYGGIPLLPTFHPSAVLRNENWKRPVWEDLKALRAWLIDHTEYNPAENGTEPGVSGEDE